MLREWVVYFKVTLLHVTFNTFIKSETEHLHWPGTEGANLGCLQLLQ